MKDRTDSRRDWRFNGVHYAIAIVFAAAGIFGMASVVASSPTNRIVQHSSLH